MSGKSPVLMLLLASLGLGLLHGCAGAVVGAAATGAAVAIDRRSTGEMIDDQSIELKIMSAVYNQEDLFDNIHVSATSMNGIVLLTGQAPTVEMRGRVERLARQTDQVRAIQSEVSIGTPSSLLTRSGDAWVTTKVKTALFVDHSFDASRIKVVTESGTVYLMGIVTRDEADEAVATTRQVSGVKRVVKVFEYIQ